MGCLCYQRNDKWGLTRFDEYTYSGLHCFIKRYSEFRFSLKGNYFLM